MATVKNENEVKVEEKATEDTAETGAGFKDKIRETASKAGAVCKRLLPFGGGLIGGFILGRATAPKQSDETSDEDNVVMTDDGDNIIV